MVSLLFPRSCGPRPIVFFHPTRVCGGMSSEQYFHVEFPPQVLLRFTTIHLLEALAIVIALQLWGHLWRGRSVVSSLNSGHVRDKLLAVCL